MGSACCLVEMNNTYTIKTASNISTVSYKLTHLLYETAEGKYRTVPDTGNLEALDTELFMRCFQSVEDILDGWLKEGIKAS